MATALKARGARSPHVRDTFESVLGVASLVLLGLILVALVRGAAHWSELTRAVWIHLGLLIVVLALTPVLLLRQRGDRWHRRLGWVWSVAMAATALVSLDIRLINRGGFSWIHLLSAFVLVSVPLLVWRAWRHQVAQHRKTVRGLVLGALIIAGSATFLGSRTMAQLMAG